MGKFIFAIMTVFVIELALFLFSGAEYTQSSLFNLIMDPSSYKTNSLYDNITSALLLVGAVGIIASSFFQINIYGVYALIGTAALTFGVSTIHLASFVYGQLSAISPDFATPITAMIVGPFLLFYIIATMEWVRSNT